MLKGYSKTIRQQRAINLYKEAIAEAVGENGRGRRVIKSDILKMAGYSRAIQLRPDKVFNSKAVKPELDKIIKNVERKRDMILNAITEEKAKEAKLKDLASSAFFMVKTAKIIAGEDESNAPKTFIMPIQIIKKYNNPELGAKVS